MNYSKHCSICENVKSDLHRGLLCALTNEKPNFEYKCKDIKFGNKLINKITEVNTNYELVKISKKAAFTHLLIYLIIGMLFIISSIIIGSFILKKGFISTVPLLIFGVGLAAILFAVKPIGNYMNKKKISETKKKKLDDLLKIYKLQYKIDFDFQEVHGTTEVKSNVKILRDTNT